MYKLLTFEEIADELARALYNEIELRGLSVKHSGETVRTGNVYIANFSIPFEQQKPQQISFGDLLNSADLTLPIVDFRDKKILRWAREMSCKMCRPFAMTMYDLELPRAVFGAVIGRYKEVSVRLVANYVIELDALVYRFDTVVAYDDGVK